MTSVLVGIDGSEGARRAAEFGRNVARAFNAHLTFLHVIERLPAWVLAGHETPEGDWYARQMQRAAELLADLSVDLQTPEAETAIEMGHPVDVICREAQERNVDLIVVGRHGNRPGPRLILGSVGSNVAATTNCSVTIVQ